MTTTQTNRAGLRCLVLTGFLSSDILCRTFCLGSRNTIQGTGFAIEVGGRQYLVTANHVAEKCGYQPQLLLAGWDATVSWKTIGKNEVADVAVLAANRQICPTWEVRLDQKGVILGTIGFALGFPMDYGVDWIQKLEQPYAVGSVPMASPITFYVPQATPNDHYHYWGSVTMGFSGGPATFPVNVQSSDMSPLPFTNKWSIHGVVLGYAKHSFEADKDGRTLDLKITYDQPVGMVKVAGNRVFLAPIHRKDECRGVLKG